MNEEDPVHDPPRRGVGELVCRRRYERTATRVAASPHRVGELDVMNASEPVLGDNACSEFPQLGDPSLTPSVAAYQEAAPTLGADLVEDVLGNVLEHWRRESDVMALRRALVNL